MMVPPDILTVPLFLTLRSLGLLDARSADILDEMYALVDKSKNWRFHPALLVRSLVDPALVDQGDRDFVPRYASFCRHDSGTTTFQSSLDERMQSTPPTSAATIFPRCSRRSSSAITTSICPST